MFVNTCDCVFVSMSLCAVRCAVAESAGVCVHVSVRVCVCVRAPVSPRVCARVCLCSLPKSGDLPRFLPDEIKCSLLPVWQRGGASLGTLPS